MAVQERRYTVAEFEQFIELPENADRLFEYIGGKIVEVVSNTYASAVAARVNYWISHYVIQHESGHVTGADGGYVVAGERYIPDVAFVAKARQPQLDRPYCPIPPDLAVEVLSPSNNPRAMRLKIANYLVAGTVVWVVDPDRKMVEVYTPGQAARTIGIDETLDGGEVLPGFTVAVKEIFPV